MASRTTVKKAWVPTLKTKSAERLHILKQLILSRFPCFMKL